MHEKTTNKINKKAVEAMDKKFPRNHYDKQGKVIGLGTWAKLLEDENYRMIKREDIKIGRKVYFVSTVWLGIDHGWAGKKPLLFETMIFRNTVKKDKSNLNRIDVYQDRYCTEKEAIAGHKKVVKLLKQGKLEMY